MTKPILGDIWLTETNPGYFFRAELVRVISILDDYEVRYAYLCRKSSATSFNNSKTYTKMYSIFITHASLYYRDVPC